MKIYSVPLFFIFLVSSSLANVDDHVLQEGGNLYVDSVVRELPEHKLLPVSSTLQLFTHGKPGQLLIQGEWKNAEAIAVWLRQQFVLNNYKQINIYGCEFAKDDKGLAAVTYLEQQLGISVAASTNITGKDGDWILEIGKEINVISLPGYQYNLQCSASPTVTVAANTSCISSNGSITVTNALTPTVDYEYSKDGGVTWQTSNIFNNLAGGSYNVRYRNINAATAGAPCYSSVLQSTVSTTTTAPATPAGTATAATSCSSPNGSISLNAYTSTSGNSNFEFSIDGTTWITANGTTTVPYGVIFNNLAPGTYNVVARSKITGCVSANSTNISVAASPAVIAPAGTATATNCTSATGQISLSTYTNTSGNSNFEFSIDGTTWVTANGTSTAPYGVTFSNLAPGTYNITAKNISTGCVSAISANISVGTGTAVTAPAGTATAATSCSSPNGSISLNTYTNTSGNSNFEFSIDGTTWITANGTSTAPYRVVFSNLAPGTYNIVARSKITGCVSANSTNITIATTAIATTTTTNVANTNCTTAPNGSITITNATYTPIANYSFSINNATTWQTGAGMNVFSNLAEGNYNVLVRNNVTGCISSALIVNLTNTATVPATPAGTVTASSACNASTGQISLSAYTATSGNSNFEFSIDGTTWVTANGTSTAPYGVTFSNLAPGTYNISAKNISTGCVSAISANIIVGTGTAVTAPAGTATAASNCASNTGQITLSTYTGASGNTNFEFSIDGTTWITANGTTTAPYGVVFNNLASRTYNIVARNKTTGCSSVNSANIIVGTGTAVTAPAGTATAATSCSTPNGSISLNAYTGTSGNTNFEFSIDGTTWITANGTTTAPYGVVFNNLAPGTYNIVARNKTTGCSSANSTNINLAASVAVTAPAGTATTPTSCSTPNGLISLNAYTNTSGNSNFEFNIDGTTWITANGSVTAPYGVVFSNLASGTYHIVARNKTTGCSSANSANITVATAAVPATPTVTSVSSTSCLVDNGTITVTAPTPLSSFQFSIDDGVTWQASSNFTGLAPSANYKVVVRNIVTGCISLARTTTITGPSLVAAPVLSATNLTDCNTPNGSIVFMPPTDSYNYSFTINNGNSFSSNPSFTSLNTGIYYCAIKNINTGCVSVITATETITLTNATPVIASINNNATSCFPNGSITVTTPASGSGYLYSNDGGTTWQSSNIFSNLDAGIYKIKAKRITTGCETAVSQNILTNSGAITPPDASGIWQTCNELGSIRFSTPTPLNYFTFSIDGGNTFSSSPTFANLAVGTYPVVVKSISTGCLSKSKNAYIGDTRSVANCTDSDGDGIRNIADLDDDNDGVIDLLESNCNVLPQTTLAYATSVVDNNNIGGGLGTLNATLGAPDGAFFSMGDLGSHITFKFDFIISTNGTSAHDFIETEIGASEYVDLWLLPVGNTSAIIAARGISVAYDEMGYIKIGALDGVSSIDIDSTFNYAFIPGELQFTNAKLVSTSNAGGTSNAGPDIDAVRAVVVMTLCNADLDTDNDGIFNRLDLDSDGDGCSDAFETGITGTLITGTLVNNSGITTSNNAIAQGGYGANGFANALETGAESGVYSGSYGNYTNAINSSIKTCIVFPQTKPDANCTYVGVEVTGNVSTNDVVPVGSTYSNVTTVPGYTNPSGAMAVLTGNNGVYTFTTTTAGIYKFLVTVCPSGVSVGCPVEELVITVLDKNVQTNPPLAIPDFAITKMNTAVVISTLQNDRSGNSMTTLNLTSVSVTTSPKHGTYSVNSTTGNITYTPASSFTGVDTLRYTVCDNAPTPNCTSAIEIITVLPASATNSLLASDDYVTTTYNTATGGGVILNDIDPDGNAKSVTPQNTTVSGKGTLVLNAVGSYTFTPVSGFSGPVDFAYTVCDDGSPVTCSRATLHILVTESTAALPVKLISFNGFDKREGNMLEWKTSSEINSSHFDVLYSTTGQSFVKTGSVAASGNSSSVLTYNYLHTQPQAGNNFYQLLSVDIDGKKEYSKIINIRLNAKNELTVYPVPANDEVMVQGSKEELSTLKLYNTSGQDITGMAQIVKFGDTVSIMYIKQLPTGIYYLKTKTQSGKIVKQ